MRLHVWDKHGHGYSVDGTNVLRFDQLSAFEESWSQASVLAIHTGEELWVEESIASVVDRALNATTLTILLFSGGGARRPAQIRSEIDSYLEDRVHPLSDVEFSLRVARALKDPLNHLPQLTAPDRSVLAYDALNAAFMFQLHVENGSPEPKLDKLRIEARERFRSIDGQWGDAPLDPFNGEYGGDGHLNASVVNTLISACMVSRDTPTFCIKLKAIRDSLINWADLGRLTHGVDLCAISNRSELGPSE